MKYLIIIIASFVLSCNEQSVKDAEKDNADSSKEINSTTVPTGKSTTPSEFNKGNSSPVGSGGGVDSAVSAGHDTNKTDTGFHK